MQTVGYLAKEKSSAHSGIAHRLSQASQSELKHQVLGIRALERLHVKIVHLKGKAEVW